MPRREPTGGRYIRHTRRSVENYLQNCNVPTAGSSNHLQSTQRFAGYLLRLLLLSTVNCVLKVRPLHRKYCLFVVEKSTVLVFFFFLALQNKINKLCLLVWSISLMLAQVQILRICVLNHAIDCIAYWL